MKDKLIQVRWSDEQKEKIREYAKSQGYDDISKFIRDVVNERVEGDIGLKERLLILLDDPDIEKKIRRK
jgi:hypothetical protein